MSNLKKSAFCAGIILSIALYQVITGYLPRVVLSKLKPLLSAQNIAMDFEGASYSLPAKLNINRLGLVFPTPSFPLPLSLDRFMAELRILPLFMGHTAIQSTFGAYGGEVTLQFDKSLFSNNFEIETKSTQVALGLHPILATFFLQGTIDSTFTESLSADSKLRARLDISLANGSYKGGHTIQSGLIVLPEVKDVNGQCSSSLLSEDLRVYNCKLQSSLGSIDFSGRGNIASGTFEFQSGKATADISLTKTGVDKIAGYLALAANLDPDTTVANWQIEFSVERGRITTSIHPLG